MRIPSILSTDLSLDRDPDDWLDTTIFLTHVAIKPVGIILDHYATDAVEEKARYLLSCLGMTQLEVVR